MITSDHGEGLWDHGVRDHGRDLYEEMTRVPLVVWRPDARDAGRVIDTAVSLVDIAPTILGALALPVPPGSVWQDLSIAIGGFSDPERTVYSELDFDEAALEAARTSDLKLIRNRKRVPRDEFVELYDLSQDPHERNVLGFQRTVARATLETRLGNWLDVQAASAIETNPIDLSLLDRESRRNLEALGYLDALPPVSAGPQPILDFTRSDGGDDQLVDGFYEHEFNLRWMAGRASVVLGRRATEHSWRLAGWVDLALHDRDKLSLFVGVDGNERVTRHIEKSGFFLFEGELPTGSTDVVRLDLECDHDFVPASDQRPLCVAIQSVGLY